MIAALGTVTHFREAWPGNTPFILSEYGQAAAFLIAGVVGGALASAERGATRRLQQAVTSLEAANAELRASHEQLRRADRLSSLGEIAAGLAHEIRNPLGAVKGALEIIESRAAAASPEAEFATLASREIARLDNLISEFLAYARPHDPERREVDIYDVLERVASLVAGEAERHGVVLDLKRTLLPTVSIDAEQMAQVFLNLVLNAVQVTPSGGHVQIAATGSPGTLMVDVCDQGPGIPEEHRTRVFDPFFSTKKNGTGLGLSISQRIVQSHGGSIDVLQAARGTIVRVLLPCAAERRT